VGLKLRRHSFCRLAGFRSIGLLTADLSDAITAGFVMVSRSSAHAARCCARRQIVIRKVPALAGPAACKCVKSRHQLIEAPRRLVL
jgi:hypothetical protein